MKSITHYVFLLLFPMSIFATEVAVKDTPKDAATKQIIIEVKLIKSVKRFPAI